MNTIPFYSAKYIRMCSWDLSSVKADPEFSPFYAGYLAEFRKRVPFRKPVLSNANQLFESMKVGHNCYIVPGGCTMVSVHLRLGDYTKIMRKRNLPAIVSDTDYLENAFQHVIKNYTVCFQPIVI